jgi:hypothetical protein
MTAELALMAILAGTGSPTHSREARDEQQAYYAARYQGEHGPFASQQQAIDASLTMLYKHAEAERWGCEWLTLQSRDRYGRWWYSTPKTGHAAGPNQCEVRYSSAELRRPDSTLVGTAHTHPRGDVFPDPRPKPPDNQNPHPMLLVRSDGSIWHFPPASTTPTLFGRMVKDRGRVIATHVTILSARCSKHPRHSGGLLGPLKAARRPGPSARPATSLDVAPANRRSRGPIEAA